MPKIIILNYLLPLIADYPKQFYLPFVSQLEELVFSSPLPFVTFFASWP
jgi:hypothetical protein